MDLICVVSLDWNCLNMTSRSVRVLLSIIMDRQKIGGFSCPLNWTTPRLRTTWNRHRRIVSELRCNEGSLEISVKISIECVKTTNIRGSRYSDGFR